MKQEFTQEELKNIASLIQNSPIKGGDAIVVGNLLIKISSMLSVPTKVAPKAEEVKKVKDGK